MNTDTNQTKHWLTTLRRFFASDWFGLILVLLALPVIFTNQFVYGGLAFALLFCAVFLFCSDITVCFLPFLLITAFSIQAKNSFNDYMEVTWVLPIIFLCFLARPIIYRNLHRPKVGKLFLPIALVSVTCLLGGVGILTKQEYFSTISIAYMLCLGVLILFFYWLFGALIYPGANGTDLDRRLAKDFCYLILFLFLSVLEYYYEHRVTFLAHPGILPFQWRNNACTLLLMAMPFPFYLAKEKLGYIGYVVIALFTILLTGSRGGMLFGLIELLLLILFFAIKDKKHRKVYIGISIAGVLGVCCAIPFLLDFLSYTLSRFTMASGENAIRLGLWQRALEDFMANPLTGRGLGYMGNRDIHASATATLCWYHCSPLQIIGSFGLLGVLTYGFQLYKRIRLFTERKNLFANTVFLSFIGLELMSLVNPGIFVPLYLIFITILFVVVENYETIGDDVT